MAQRGPMSDAQAPERLDISTDPGPSPSWYTPVPDAPVCAGCGEALGMSGPGWWRLDARPWHARCADWSTRPMPLRWALDAARRLTRALDRDGAPEPPHLRRAIACLLDLERSWPPQGDPTEALARAGDAAEYVRRCLDGQATARRR